MNDQIRRAIELVGSGAALASELGRSPQFVSQLLRGDRPVPQDLCPAIERACRELGGEVTCEELRPDLTWLRVPADGWPHGKPVLDVAPNGSIKHPVVSSPPVPPAPRPLTEAPHPIAAAPPVDAPSGPTLYFGDRRILGDRRREERPQPSDKRSRRDRREW